MVGPLPKLPSGGFIVCSNHAGYLDPVFIQLVLRRRVRFLMTNDFYRRRWGRWFFRLVGAIPVGSGRLSHEGIQRAAALLQAGYAVGIFPEGRLSTDGALGPGHRGVAVLAQSAGTPLLPLGLVGNREAWPKGERPHRSHVRASFAPFIAPPAPTPPLDREAGRTFAASVMEHIRKARDRAAKDSRHLV